MTLELLRTLMARTQLVVAVIAAVAVLAWQRSLVLDVLEDRWTWVGLAVAGFWIGWAFKPEIAGVLDAIPL